MPFSQVFQFSAPAKLNLGLKIVGKRPDGYHLLKSIFCLIDLMDTIEIEITNDGYISLIDHNYAWKMEDDLAYKSAMLLKNITQTKLGAKIKVIKKIPDKGGLGGGSSDAATVLIGLNKLWKTGLNQEKLIQIGIELGADIPFFILGQNAYVEGIGEVLTPFDIPSYSFVLIKPEFGCSTKEIFNQLKPRLSDLDIDSKKIFKEMKNDLQEVALKLNPHLLDIQNKLKNYGKPIMSGSGSTLFLKYDNHSDAIKVANDLEILYNCYLVRNINFSPMKDFL